MTETTNSDVQDERSQLEVLESLDIAMLRKTAKILNIEARRDWDKGDFIKAVQDKQNTKTAPAIVFNDANAPKPGHARIVLHRDPTPGHKNGPVQVGVNGRLLHIPRGIQVDIPIPFVEALNNARSTITRQQQDVSRQSPGGIYKDEELVSYPFQVIQITPGDNFINAHDGRAQEYSRRKAFADKFGRWPTTGELRDALQAQLIHGNKA